MAMSQELEADQEVVMVLQAHDRHCNMRTIGGDEVEVVLDEVNHNRLTGGVGGRVRAGVEDMQDGTYRLTFTLGFVGAWVMSVFVNRQPVRAPPRPGPLSF